MKNKIAVAIDGPSGAGKSSLAKMLAAKYGLVYVDTGAIYRSVGLACFRKGIDRKDAEAVSTFLPELDIDISYDENGLQHMILNGEDVTADIRMPEISICASDVSALPACRAYLLDLQRDFAAKYSVVMDGRDIGTVVLPDAELKVFLTASAEQRAFRRLKELKDKGVETTFEEVLHDIEYRDYQDSHREIAPLAKANDAVLLDTSELSLEQSLNELCKLVDGALAKL